MDEILHYYDGKLIQTYQSFGFRVVHYPIPDHEIPRSMRSFSELQPKLVKLTEFVRVLIHCYAGKGRTGLVAAALFITLGSEPEKAIQMVRWTRPGSVETIEQEQFLRDYAQHIAKSE